jgi:hypothetical protein
LLKVDHTALFIIDFNLRLVEFLPNPLVYGSNQPKGRPQGRD